MKPTNAFIRSFFVIISLLFMITYSIGLQPNPTGWNYGLGIALGLGVGGILFGLDALFRRFNLRAFNVVLIGLFIGYLMGLALLLIFETILEIAATRPSEHIVEFVKIFIFLFGTYLGVIMTLRASDEIYVSIPFVKFSPTAQKTKDLLLDSSALGDPRIIDLAASGLLNYRLLLPRFVLKELQEQEESSEEMTQTRAKRASEVVRKLETMPELNLRYQDTDFPEVKDMCGKILRLARLIDAEVVSADINRVQMAQVDGIRVINLHELSNALKPLMQRGEFMNIKIQRHGKEDRQGVGYLEDGTMVVVNGGGDYIGETIQTSVLSVKHTSSGRMIFCNVADDEEFNGKKEPL